MANYNKPDAPPPYGMQVPPQGPYPPQPPVAVVNLQPQPAIVRFGPNSQGCICPHCHSQISSQVKSEATAKTHLFALLLFILFCPCVCLPYCMDSCQSTNHYCPSCGAYLGTYDH